MTRRRAIRLNGREIAYTLTRSTRRRTIGVKVGREGVRVTLPARAGEHEAARLLKEKSDWVLDKLDRWAARPEPPALRGADGETVSRLGRVLRVSVEEHARARTRVEREGSSIRVFIDAALPGEMREATVRRAVERWRKQDAEAFIPPRVAHYAARLDRPAPVVKLRRHKARWGSCAADGVIRINMRMMAYEEALIDYVCAHEACHLLEMNHGPRFKALLDRLMPDHRERRRALMEQAPPGAAV